jgi:hypothetical protein
MVLGIVIWGYVRVSVVFSVATVVPHGAGNWFVGVFVGMYGSTWVGMGTLESVWLKNDGTWCLALLYGGT